MQHSESKTQKEELEYLYALLDEVTNQLQQLQGKNAPVPDALFENLDSILKKIVALKDE